MGLARIEKSAGQAGRQGWNHPYSPPFGDFAPLYPVELGRVLQIDPVFCHAPSERFIQSAIVG